MSFWTLVAALVVAIVLVTVGGVVVGLACGWLADQIDYRRTAPRTPRTAKQTEQAYRHALGAKARREATDVDVEARREATDVEATDVDPEVGR